jgi:acyl-CoA thioesterase-2
MSELWNDLLACLDLQPQTTGRTDTDKNATTLVFEGPNLHLTYHRLFGGQILGQFVRAAELTCPNKSIKSLHSLFAREGSADETVRYEVTRQHEGRSFATLTIVARQSKGVIATSLISMHAPEDGPDRQSENIIAPLLGEEFRTDVDLIPWEIRTDVDLNSTDIGAPDFEMWMRTPQVGKNLAPALATYATDLTLIGTALRPVDGLSQLGNGTTFTSAVTSHNLWFHRPFTTDSWLLLRQHSPVTAHGRCFGRGDVFSEDGNLVASYAQEALLRLP